MTFTKFTLVMTAIVIAVMSISARADASQADAQPTIFLVNGSVTRADKAVLALAGDPQAEVYKCQLQRITINKKTGKIGTKKLDKDND